MGAWGEEAYCGCGYGVVNKRERPGMDETHGGGKEPMNIREEVSGLVDRGVMSASSSTYGRNSMSVSSNFSQIDKISPSQAINAIFAICMNMRITSMGLDSPFPNIGQRR